MADQLSADVLADLRNSGLSDTTIAAMRLRPPSSTELPRTLKGHEGYVIAYHDTSKVVIPDYFRVKLLPGIKNPQGKTVKYIQPANSTPHIYLPPNTSSKRWFSKEDIIITEGEKKAAKGMQEGFLTLGLGGVDAWRTRTFKVTPEKVHEGKKSLILKLAKHSDVEQLEEQVAPELLRIPWAGRTVWLVFDAESDEVTNANVQRAMFDLAIWLSEHGANPVQIDLPSVAEKTGLDDFLVLEGAEGFQRLLDTSEQKFPVHPTPKAWVQRQLNMPQIKRPTQLKVARAVLASLDRHGNRFLDALRNYYYFDGRTKVLHEFRWDSNELRQVRLSSFGTLLFDEFGIGTADANTLARVADDFTALRPIREVRPRTVVATSGDSLYFQTADSRLARVRPEAIDFVDNGTDGMLFRSGQVDELDEGELRKSLRRKIQGLWYDTLTKTNLEPIEGMTIEQTHILLACLYHLSPWLRRWRGLMLPLELAIAEPNSGKTFLYNLRRGVLTGRPSLDNPPTDIRDWYASIAAAPGLWVCDNMGELRRDLRERMSDELARLITDPDPSAELRELYTTSTVSRIPIDCAFAATAIWNPFFKADILQRAIVTHLRAIPAGQRNSMWYQELIDKRPDWVAEHLKAAQAFFKIVQNRWNPNYLSGHRLTHFEQSIHCMGEALGFSKQMDSIVSLLAPAVQASIAEHDPMMEALKAFAEEWFVKNGSTNEVNSREITNWVLADVDGRYAHIKPLTNAISLGRYLAQHSYDVENSAGLKVTRRQSNTFLNIIPEVIAK